MLLPISFVAYALNVYDVPLSNPFTTIEPDPLVEVFPVNPPGVETAVYDVIVVPPVYIGAEYPTNIAVLETVLTVSPVGGLGKSLSVVI